MQHLTKTLDMSEAPKKLLFHICFHEHDDRDNQYEALRELQLRRWSDIHLQKLVKWWGQGKTAKWIAVQLGVDEEVVKWQLQNNGLYGVRRVGA